MKYAKLLALALGGLLISGCGRDFEPGGSGRLSIDLSTDISLEEISATRARVAVPGLETPGVDEFSLKITRGGETVWSGAFTDYPGAEYLLEAGEYTATVACGDIDDEGFGRPAFGATETFTIVDDETTPVSMTAGLVNMAVTVKYTGAFREYFETFSATLRRDAEIALFGKDNVDVAFVKPAEFDLTVDYRFPWNGVAEKWGKSTYTVKNNIAPATLLRVTFDANAGEIGTGGITISFNDDIDKITLDPIDIGGDE